MGGEAPTELDLFADLIAAARLSPQPQSLASHLLSYFGSIDAALAASPSRIAQAAPEAGASVGALLAAARAVWLHCLRAEVAARPVMSGATGVLDYLRASMAASPVEEFRVLFLDAGNGLIAEHLFGAGTVSQVTVYPREIIARALNVGADGLILVHNHPSGSSEPSPSDIVTTRQIAAAAESLDIRVHDHVIIGRSGSTSLRARGLL